MIEFIAQVALVSWPACLAALIFLGVMEYALRKMHESDCRHDRWYRIFNDC